MDIFDFFDMAGEIVEFFKAAGEDIGHLFNPKKKTKQSHFANREAKEQLDEQIIKEYEARRASEKADEEELEQTDDTESSEELNSSEQETDSCFDNDGFESGFDSDSDGSSPGSDGYIG